MNRPKPSIEKLSGDERRVSKELAFTVVCKNTGKTHSYFFGGRPEFDHLRPITEIFVWALYKRRHHVGHVSRLAARDLLWKFLNFLSETNVTLPSQLSRETQVQFIHWLKNQADMSYATAGAKYRCLGVYFTEMSKHKDVSVEFRPIRNAFPRSSSLQTVETGYDDAELKAILRAAALGLRESMAKFNYNYIRRWEGVPAPLDDVAPEGKRGRRSFWYSLEYKIWWWENVCGCRLLNSSELSQLPQGQGFIASFSSAGKTGMVGVRDFYDFIGAGEKYVPKYLGQPCPVKYLTPWKKMDYLVWYWENEVGCQPLAGKRLKQSAPKLYGALKEYFDGRVEWFYEQLGVSCWLSGRDLVPLYLMLLIRTQLNPSTLQRLTIDCLEQDPINPDRQKLRWVKYRSSRAGHTIPSDTIAEEWPVRLVNKVISITAPFRLPGQTSLWISNANRTGNTLPLGNSGFKDALSKFSTQYGLKHSSGEPLSIQAKLIRPTVAMLEYIRTESMPYLQALLSHAKPSTTADYLRRGGDKVLKLRRGLHQEAMLLGLTGDTSVPKSEPGSDAFLNHCKEPLKSPIAGQREGSICSAAHEVCLGCPNLVITLEDVKKFFCFVNYHKRLEEAGVITADEYRKATEEKRHVWETQILPRYHPEVVRAVEVDADRNPLQAWSV